MFNFIFFLSFISLNHTTDILEPIEESVSTRPYIVSNRKSDQIEEIFFRNMSLGTAEDLVCSLTKEKKIALCQRIFQLPHYKSLGIYLNKIAFSITGPHCEKNSLTLHTKFDFRDKMTFNQKMIPCRGRHTPIRTSFIEDDYYAKYYVSAGPIDNSVMVYVYGYDDNDHWFNIYDYLENINLSELPDVFVELSEIIEELGMNKEITSTRDNKEIEYIYATENNYLPIEDPVCNIDLPKKISLCQLIFNQHIYRNFFWIRINKAAYFCFEPLCEDQRLKFRYPKNFKDEIIYQVMLSCYGRNHLVFGDVMDDNYNKYFYISSGPRKNSIVVYIRIKRNSGEDDFYLFDLLENVYIQDLNPAIIEYGDLAAESLYMQSIIGGLILGEVLAKNYEEKEKEETKSNPKMEKETETKKKPRK